MPRSALHIPAVLSSIVNSVFFDQLSNGDGAGRLHSIPAESLQNLVVDFMHSGRLFFLGGGGL